MQNWAAKIIDKAGLRRLPLYRREAEGVRIVDPALLHVNEIVTIASDVALVQTIVGTSVPCGDLGMGIVEHV
ncbi:MAG: hypothetical protein M3014_07780, partial [Chloroflexota bacterium]|nr:hypothetical protein [Chloroflexota bacterium]